MHLLFAIDIFAILDTFSHTATNNDRICLKNETFFFEIANFQAKISIVLVHLVLLYAVCLNFFKIIIIILESSYAFIC